MTDLLPNTVTEWHCLPVKSPVAHNLSVLYGIVVLSVVLSRAKVSVLYGIVILSVVLSRVNHKKDQS